MNLRDFFDTMPTGTIATVAGAGYRLFARLGLVHLDIAEGDHDGADPLRRRVLDPDLQRASAWRQGATERRMGAL
jgi:hypothetical protein